MRLQDLAATFLKDDVTREETGEEIALVDIFLRK